MTGSVITTIVVILGIIIAGGFLLYFMGDLLMSISNKNKDKEAIKNKQAKEQQALEQRVSALENAKDDPQIATILYNGGIVENYNPEEEEKEEEENAEETPVEENEEATEEVAEEVATEEETEESAEETEEDDETSEYIRQRRLELMERLAKMQEENEEETEEGEETVDVTEEETPAEETAEETTEETTEVAEEEATEEVTEEVSAEEVVAEEATEEAEEATEETVEEVAEETTEEETEEAQNVLTPAFTLEELEAQLVEEQEKLKTNEKELRQCKKDYLPLRRVKKTLENDEKKLRRKEALVAKQKVVLYGVNNYADIDEEKAKKLAEDLDLLDGLKLSVQHCEEVMSKNEERYPLLEKIYNLLSAQNEELKSNVNELQEAIAELKAQGEGDTSTDDTATDAE